MTDDDVVRPPAHDDARLAPYVPRLLLDWDGEPGHRRLEGTLVSADIAGFTALGERLANMGREGSEELTAILNERFSEMVALVHERGGDVLKFGGDAILCWFQGDGHADRALHAADRIRAGLRAPVATEMAGSVRLGVSIGMHSGRHDLAVLGVGAHLELVVAGPGATATIAAESAADAGEIVASRASAAHLSPGGIVEDRGVHLVVRPVGEDRRPGPPNRGERGPDAYLPESQRAWLRIHSRTLGEHRRAPILFVWLGDTDHDLAADRPDRFVARLTAAFRAIAAVCDRHGVSWLGTDVGEGGVKVILGAGLPRQVRDEDAAAVWVADQLVREVTDVPTRVGVHRGPVFLGNLGSATRRVYTVMGDTVNTAARLMGRASSGQALATGDVLVRASLHVETTELAPWTPKGKSEPLVPLRIRSVRPRDVEQDLAADASFVGRADELGRLVHAWEQAAAGTGSSASVAGEAGAGKSRLVREFLTRVRPDHVLRARGYLGGHVRPHHFLVQPMRQAIGMSASLGPERAGAALHRWVETHLPRHVGLVPLIAPAFGATVTATPESQAVLPEFAGERMAVALHDLLVVALREPTLLLFEDADFADLASRSFLQHLLDRTTGHPWCVLVSSRDGTLAQGTGDDIRLHPLRPEELEEVVRYAIAFSGATMTAPRVRALADRAGGNPLFALELGMAHDLDELPETVEDAVTLRLDRLDVDVRRQVLEAAVLGISGDLEVLSGALGLAGDGEEWQPASSFVVVAGTQLRYRHAVYQEVAYSLLSYRLRRRLHRRVGEWYESHRPDDRLALSGQWSAARDHGRAWRYSILAAEEARNSAALADTLTLYERALGHGRRLRDLDRSELGRVAEQAADIAELVGDYDLATSALSNARDWFDRSLTSEVRLMSKLGVIEERRGHYRNALRWAGKARRLIESGAGPAAEALAADVHALVASVRYRQGHYEDCIVSAEQAAVAARVAGSDRALARAYQLLESASTYLGIENDFGEWSVALYRRVGDERAAAQTLNNLGVAAYFSGDWVRATDRWRDVVEVMEAAGAVQLASVSHNNLGELFSDQGRYEEALLHFAEAITGFRAVGFEMGVHVVTANLGRLSARRGDLVESVHTLEAALAGFEELGNDYFIGIAHLRLAEARLEEGDLDAVEQHVEIVAAASSTDPTTASAVERIRAHVDAVRGDLDRARARVMTVLTNPDANEFERGMTAYTASAIGAPVDLDPRDVLDPMGVRGSVRPAGHERLLEQIQLPGARPVASAPPA